MRVEHHAAVSLLFSGLLLGLFKSWPLALASLASGVLMDADHLPDFFLHHGPRFNLKAFFRASYEREYKRIFIILHSWELIVPGGLAAWLSGWNPWILGLLAGWIHHMIADQIVNRPHKWGYFITGRWRVRFDHDTVFPRQEAPLSRKNRETFRPSSKR